MLLRTRPRPNELPRYFRQMLGEFALKVGFVPNGQGPTFAQAVDAYFLNRPLDPELLAAFQQWVTAALGVAPVPPRYVPSIRG